jgi:hypothetical protein
MARGIPYFVVGRFVLRAQNLSNEWEVDAMHEIDSFCRCGAAWVRRSGAAGARDGGKVRWAASAPGKEAMEVGRGRQVCCRRYTCGRSRDGMVM